MVIKLYLAGRPHQLPFVTRMLTRDLFAVANLVTGWCAGVCLSVCPSLCPLHLYIVSKRLKISLTFSRPDSPHHLVQAFTLFQREPISGR